MVGERRPGVGELEGVCVGGRVDFVGHGNLSAKDFLREGQSFGCNPLVTHTVLFPLAT